MAGSLSRTGGTTGGTSSGGSVSVPTEAVYVSISGSDSNDGTNKSYPLKTINLAVERARQYSKPFVLIAGGNYSSMAGLDPGVSTNINNAGCALVITNINNLSIIGGWNNTFDSLSGQTVLDISMFPTYRGVYIGSVKNVSISGLTIQNANTTNTAFGGGICVQLSSALTLSNLNIQNCSACSGGGIYLETTSNCLIQGSFMNNGAISYGGGINLNWGCDNITIIADMKNNILTNNGGPGQGAGVYAYAAYNSRVINSTIRNNSINCTASGAAEGGGLFVMLGLNFLMSNCVIIGNCASNVGMMAYGGAVSIIDASNCIVANNVMTNNWCVSATGSNAVICLYESINDFLYGLVIKNNLIGGADPAAIGILERWSSSTLNSYDLSGNGFQTNSLTCIGISYLGGNNSNNITALNSSGYGTSATNHTVNYGF